MAASIQTQATTKAAAELSSVRLATTIAFHTRTLLQDLGLDKPFAFRVLTGGPLAQKLGLSKKTRHIQLRSRFGQFQLSKVQPRQNLAEQLANTQTACGLHRFLPKLKMHLGGRTFPTASQRSKFARGEKAQPSSASGVGRVMLYEAEQHQKLLDSIAQGECVAFPVFQHELARRATKEADVMDKHFKVAVRVLSRGLRQRRKELSLSNKQMAQEVSKSSEIAAESLLSTRRRLQTIPMCLWRSLPLSMPSLSSQIDPRQCPQVHQHPQSPQERASVLAEAWREKHLEVKQSTCPLREKRPPKLSCFQTGLCTCKGAGRKHFRIKQRLAQYLRNLSEDESFAELLNNGYVLLQWTGRLPATGSACTGSTLCSITLRSPNLFLAHQIYFLGSLSEGKNTFQVVCAHGDLFFFFWPEHHSTGFSAQTSRGPRGPTRSLRLSLSLFCLLFLSCLQSFR